MGIREQIFGNHVVVSGRNAVVGTAWEELYSYDQALDLQTQMASAARLDIASSSANDTAAGSGARSIRIVGLDGNYRLMVEDIAMNGQTMITSVGYFLRVFGIEVLTVGSGFTNAGDIHCVKSGTGGTWTAGVPGTLTGALCKVLIGWGAAMTGMFTTPVGSSYALESIIAGSRTQAAILAVFSQPIAASPNNPLKIEHSIDLSATTATYYDLEYCGFKISFPEKTDIRLRVYGAAASAVVNASMKLRKTDGF